MSKNKNFRKVKEFPNLLVKELTHFLGLFCIACTDFFNHKMVTFF